MKETLLQAASAAHIPEGESGRWSIKKIRLSRPVITKHPRREGLVALPAGTYTKLFCATESTMHMIGELVMEDTTVELETHLDFMLRAWGRVLISGLGLGCVIRGCLANPRVKHVVCLENSPDVLKLVGPHMPKEKLTIIVADALQWTKDKCRPGDFDCAWHDLWTDTDAGQPHLALWHSELIENTCEKVKLMGAWAFPRPQKRLWNQVLRHYNGHHCL